MHHIEYENSYLTLLTGKEILNPYIVLKEVFKGSSSPVALQDELYELLTAIMRPNYWRSYQSPLVLYKKYKKLLRLFEAGWLIQKIRPEFDLSEKLSIPFKEVKVDEIKSQGFKPGSDPLTNEYQSLVQFYCSYSLSSLGREVYCLLFDGFMSGCTDGTYELDVYLIKQVQNMSELIRVLHTIGRYEQNTVLCPRDIDILNREKEALYARDNLHDYENDIYDFYEHSEKDEVRKALDISKGILRTENFWRLHGNPANILHYFHDFLFVLDYFWCDYKYIVEAGIDISTKWEIDSEVREELYNQGHKWIDRPWEFLHNQFEKDSIRGWRYRLERLLEDVLSNHNWGIFHVHDEVLYFIDSLLLLVDLLDYEPKEC